MPLPKLEGIFTVPSGGWDLSLTETGGGGASGTVTVAAGDYYLNGATSFNDALETALDAVGNATYTVTQSDADESGTGKTTISATGGGVTAFAITWTDTDQRDQLGFTGNVSGALTYTSTNRAKGLWLPTCGRTGDIPEPETGSTYFGRPTMDTVSVIAPSGVHSSIRYNTVYKSMLDFRTLLGDNVWIRLAASADQPGTLEQLWEDCIGPGKRFRYFPDRGTDSSSWELWAKAPVFNPAPLDPVYVDSAKSVFAITLECMDYVAQ